MAQDRGVHAPNVPELDGTAGGWVWRTAGTAVVAAAAWAWTYYIAIEPNSRVPPEQAPFFQCPNCGYLVTEDGTGHKPAPYKAERE